MKKLISVLLAALMLLPVLGIGFVAYAESTVVDRIDISLSDELAGKTSRDYEDIYTIETEHISYNTECAGFLGMNIRYNNIYKDMMMEPMLPAQTYIFSFWVSAEEGCTISDEVDFYIDGIKPEQGMTADVMKDEHTGLYCASFDYVITLDNGGLTVIDRIDVTLNDSIVGKSYRDYEGILSIDTPHMTYNVATSQWPIEMVYDGFGFYDGIVNGRPYTFKITLACEEGYIPSDNADVYVDGVKLPGRFIGHVRYNNNSQANTISFVFYARPGEELHSIDRLDITVTDDLAGKTYKDYKSIYTIDTPNVTYDDGSFQADNALCIFTDYASSQGHYRLPMVYGIDYILELGVVTQEGYFFADEVDIYINGEKLTDPLYYNVFDYFGYGDSSGVVSAVEFAFEKTAGGTPEETGFFADLINSIKAFFMSIVDFFKGLFA